MQIFVASILAALFLALPAPVPAPGEDPGGKESGDRGWLGVAIQDMTPRLARTMELTAKEGALVTEVVKDSPAEKAGLKDEDVIVEFNGKAVSDAEQLRTAIRTTGPGTSATLGVMRKDGRKNLTVTIGKEKAHVFTIPRAPRAPGLAMTRSGRAPLGMTLLTLNDQLGAYFKAPENRGVLVEEVRAGSEAATAGLKAGDVIVKAGRRTVEEVYDVQRAVSRADDGEKLAFEIIRNGSKQTLTVTVPAAAEEDLGGMYWFQHPSEDGDAFELDPDMPGLRKDMDHLRLELRELEGLDKKLKREMERGEGTRYRIFRKTRPGGESVTL